MKLTTSRAGRLTRKMITFVLGFAAVLAFAGAVSTPASASSTAQIKGGGSGRCIDVKGGDATNGVRLGIFDCSGGANQRFSYTSSKQVQVLGKCMDVYRNAVAPGAVVDLWDCNGQTNQQWNFNKNGTVTSVASGLCLDVLGGATTNGTPLQLWGCNGQTNQSWTVDGSTSGGGGGGTGGGGSTGSGRDPAGGQALHVSGNRILTSSGQTFRLLGVNRSGGEFSCIQGYGIWSGSTDQASINALKSWNVHAVRIPLNEQCWLGTSNVNPAYRGANYQNAVKSYVSLLLANHITPLLEMHWNVGAYSGPSSLCSDYNATCQKPMPDAQYAPTFWTQVANTFKDNRVVFELFNEPFPDRTAGSDTWSCWRNGGNCPGIGYQVAGMQTLLNAVRGTGNTNVVTVGGVGFSNDLTGWLANEPTDKTGNLAASVHIYNFNGCNNAGCFDRQLAPVAARVPLTMTEIGQDTTTTSFDSVPMSWADAHGAGYLGWTWNTWNSSTLVQNEGGTPTAAGQLLHDHLLSQ